MTTYAIHRHYSAGGISKIKSGLTLEEAQEHCRDPETSSSTATSEHAKAITHERGPWFDGYEEE